MFRLRYTEFSITSLRELCYRIIKRFYKFCYLSTCKASILMISKPITVCSSGLNSSEGMWNAMNACILSVKSACIFQYLTKNLNYCFLVLCEHETRKENCVIRVCGYSSRWRGKLVVEWEGVWLLAERHEMSELWGSFLAQTYITQMWLYWKLELLGLI